MEDLSVTVRAFSPSVAGTIRPTGTTPPASKSVARDTVVVVAPKTSSPSPGLKGDKGDQEFNVADVKEAVSNINSQLESSARSIRFQIDDTTNKLEVYIVDKETGEVVRRIPPEASIRLATNGVLSGLFNIQG